MIYAGTNQAEQSNSKSPIVLAGRYRMGHEERCIRSYAKALTAPS
jgi:hypothetical protein